MYKQDLALNNLHGLICHETQTMFLVGTYHIYFRRFKEKMAYLEMKAIFTFSYFHT